MFDGLFLDRSVLVPLPSPRTAHFLPFNHLYILLKPPYTSSTPFTPLDGGFSNEICYFSPRVTRSNSKKWPQHEDERQTSFLPLQHILRTTGRNFHRMQPLLRSSTLVLVEEQKERT